MDEPRPERQPVLDNQGAQHPMTGPPPVGMQEKTAAARSLDNGAFDTWQRQVAPYAPTDDLVIHGAGLLLADGRALLRSDATGAALEQVMAMLLADLAHQVLPPAQDVAVNPVLALTMDGPVEGFAITLSRPATWMSPVPGPRGQSASAPPPANQAARMVGGGPCGNPSRPVDIPPAAHRSLAERVATLLPPSLPLQAALAGGFVLLWEALVAGGAWGFTMIQDFAPRPGRATAGWVRLIAERTGPAVQAERFRQHDGGAILVPAREDHG